MKQIFLIFIFLTLSLSLSLQQDITEQYSACFPNNEETIGDLDSISTNLVRSRLEFSIDFARNVFKNAATGTNIFFSPHSIYQALLLSLFISQNKTEAEIKNTLRIPSNVDKLDLLKWYKTIQSSNKSVSYEIENANRFFYEKSLAVRKCMKSVFREEIYGLDFKSGPQQAKQFINAWVSKKTHNQINDLLTGLDISDETKLILVNAIYFKGQWKSKFLHQSTRKEVFYISPSKNSLVPMMKQKGSFKYTISDKLAAHVIDLPYTNEDISMFILLPSLYDPNGTKYLLERLTTDLVEELVDPNFMVERPVEVGLPKFNIEQTLFSLVPILESMGASDLFKGLSDLSALTDSKEIKFNEAIHKAKVSVDEEGTVAAAATAFLTLRSSRPLEPINFICNHPFVFFLYDHVHQSILFMGLYNTPNGTAY